MSKEHLQSQLPLYTILEEHRQQERFSVHVPGHKNGLNWPNLPAFATDFLAFDQTEVTGLDYLHAPTGVLQESQALLSQLYGSKRSFFLVNGSTVGILSMILGTVQKNDPVFVMKNAHQSVFHGLAMAAATPIFLTPEMDEEKQTMVGLAPALLAEAIATYPAAKVLILTYPNYYGQTYDLKALIHLAHAHDICVLVDEAHGAHLIVSEELPKSATQLGADVVVQSAHKMLPAMTQAAYLHVMTSRVSERKIAQYLHQLQTSSPSYLLMLSLDIARQFAGTFTKEDWAYTKKQNQKWRALFEAAGLMVWQPDDLMKLIVFKEAVSGSALATFLEKDGLYAEMADATKVVLTLPLLKVGQVVKRPSLTQTMASLKEYSAASAVLPYGQWQPVAMSLLALTYQEQAERAVESIQLAQAVQRVVAENITIYPPGIPFKVAGEVLTAADIVQIADWRRKGLRVVGLDAATTELAVYLLD
ncbi:aminotransferase class I/II-fold pyridoxal phosphate-dependent enzyme [Isobaculum melis]|uniref:Arginine/lysine/ornithine decarboxylase n=1 Tax=Isobaculum melis TaxID=142588 RepID=A0A1H9SNF6_9LACT|nr:aminotransferase class I/II-fold pyridoxal phosphate-dependent enzyme [Isobaculum melis]SER86542.1 Arginine/lysine/ornithine decarboxylase [Isobaculum melis]